MSLDRCSEEQTQPFLSGRAVEINLRGPAPTRRFLGPTCGGAVSVTSLRSARARMSSMLAPVTYKLLLAFVFATFCAAARGSTVRIHVVNGKTGKPVTNEHILVFKGKSPEVSVDRL